MIRVADLHKTYPGGTVGLAEVSLHVPKGGWLTLWGPSGAGKSTLLRLLAGMDRPTSGTVLVEGTELGSARSRELQRHRLRLGVVFQDLRLFDGRSTLENVALALALRGLPRSEALERSRRLLTELGLEQRLSARAGSLSGGERQRVVVARALACEAPLILADEPTAQLDEARARQVMDLLLEANGAGSTVVVATHDPALLARNPGQIVRLEAGRVAATGAVEARGAEG